MSDYPDWTRLFHLVGTDITIPINIEASDVTIPVSVETVNTVIKTWIWAQLVVLDVNLKASEVTIDINIAAAAVTININFSDQSVAVFDAAKWFAHNAQQVYLYGVQSVAPNGGADIITYTVPPSKEFYADGLAFSVEASTSAPVACNGWIKLGGVLIMTLGSRAGGGLAMDTPIRATAGQSIVMRVAWFGAGDNQAVMGTLWGYLEDA